MSEFEAAGFNVRVRYRKGSTISAQIKKYFDVVVNAPYCTDDVIEKFLSEKVNFFKKAFEANSKRYNEDKARFGGFDEDSVLAARQKALSPVAERRLPPIFERCLRTAGEKDVALSMAFLASCWGSCLPDSRKITLNRELADFGDDVVEMICFHEIAHLAYPHHQRGFYGRLSELCPRHRELSKILKEARLIV